MGKKIKGFWNNVEDGGFSIHDLEKVTLCLLFSISVVAIIYKFLTIDVSLVDSILIQFFTVLIQFSIGVGGLLVFRKVGSYFKKSDYYQLYDKADKVDIKNESEDKNYKEENY